MLEEIIREAENFTASAKRSKGQMPIPEEVMARMSAALDKLSSLPREALEAEIAAFKKKPASDPAVLFIVGALLGKAASEKGKNKC